MKLLYGVEQEIRSKLCSSFVMGGIRIFPCSEVDESEIKAVSWSLSSDEARDRSRSLGFSNYAGRFSRTLF